MLLLSFSMQAEIISVKTMFLYAGWKDQCEFILFWMRKTTIRKQWISWTLYIFISFLVVQTVLFTAIYVHLLSRIIGSCIYIYYIMWTSDMFVSFLQSIQLPMFIEIYLRLVWFCNVSCSFKNSMSTLCTNMQVYNNIFFLEPCVTSHVFLKFRTCSDEVLLP
jgi:hypothetical protein